MSSNLGVLGQLQPSASTLSSLYVVPSNLTVAISQLQVCNLAYANDTWSVSIAPGGIADALDQYLYYNLPIDPSDSFMTWFNFTLNSGDVIRCLSASGNISFSIFGTAGC